MELESTSFRAEKNLWLTANGFKKIRPADSLVLNDHLMEYGDDLMGAIGNIEHRDGVSKLGPEALDAFVNIAPVYEAQPGRDLHHLRISSAKQHDSLILEGVLQGTRQEGQRHVTLDLVREYHEGLHGFIPDSGQYGVVRNACCMGHPVH